MPRSPSRDLSDRYIGQRGYYRRPDALRRGKYTLAVIALVAVGAWAAFDVMQPTRAAYSHSHGPLANVHAAFDENCAACHVAHGMSEFTPASIFNATDRWHDLTCEKCHAGPTHHASANTDAKAFHNRCSNCHHDHNGRLFSLVRLADQDCTKCHMELSKWHNVAESKAKPPYQDRITSFVTDHPDFRSLDIKNKPRTLKFSHAVHMNPGQTYAAGGKEGITLARLREWGGGAAVERYRKPGQDEKSLVQLDCASCHALDSGTGTVEYDKLKAQLGAAGDPSRSLLPPRAEGAYFLPVNFETHCRSCHPLVADEGVTATGDKKFILPRFDVPHRKQPEELSAILKAGYVRELITGGHPSLAKPIEPGGKLEAQPKEITRTLGQEADRLATEAEKLLFAEKGSCAKCHTVTPGTANTMPKIVPVPDRTVWFQHAKFNHASHRGATCATCHPGAKAAYIPKEVADKPEPVQILGLKTCQACHAPAGTQVNIDNTIIAGGGARHGCTDCHRYHNGDHPFQGRGANARFTREPLDLADWLKGK